MGSVGKSLFGGSDAKSTSSSGNVNNGLLTGSLGGSTGYVSQAGDLMSSLLGGNTDALTKFSDTGGMKFLQDQGNRMITSSKAASGLLNSGSYGTALADYGQGLASTYLDKYLSQVNSLGQLGLGAGGILSDSGKTSQASESSNQKNGIIPGLAKLASAGHGG